MDKMGLFEKVGNKGFFVMFWDGVFIEIIGLFKSVFIWFDKLSKGGKFFFKGVNVFGECLNMLCRFGLIFFLVKGKKCFVMYKEWFDFI